VTQRQKRVNSRFDNFVAKDNNKFFK